MEDRTSTAEETTAGGQRGRGPGQGTKEVVTEEGGTGAAGVTGAPMSALVGGTSEDGGTTGG